MSIKKYTTNPYSSEVYRELERQAVKKGFFKPTEEEILKLAAQDISQTKKINEPIDAAPTGDLLPDVAKLAAALHRKGFSVLAKDLEESLVMYKTAECALYNVTTETNKDFFEFAHRDGDVNLNEGSGDLGDIETLQSVSDKMQAMIRKQPTGKLPKEAAMSVLASLIKQAQISDEPEIKSNYPAKVKDWLLKDIAPVKQHLETFPNLTDVADGVLFSMDKFFGENGQQWIDLWKNIGGEKQDPTPAIELFKQVRDLGIDLQDNSGNSFLKYMSPDGKIVNYPNTYRLATLVGADIMAISGVRAVFVNGQDKTEDARTNKLTTGQPINVNAKSFLIANVTNNGEIIYTWAEGTGLWVAQQYTRAFWNSIQKVFGKGLSTVQNMNKIIIANLSTVSNSIRNLTQPIPENLVDSNGNINKEAVFVYLKKIQDSYNTITKSNRPLLSIGIKLGAPAVYAQITEWEKTFYEVINKSQQALGEKAKVPMVDAKDILGKLKEAYDAWDVARQKYEDENENNKVQASMKNLQNILRLTKTLKGIGLTGTTTKPKAAFDEWLRANSFSDGADVINFANSAITLANEQG